MKFDAGLDIRDRTIFVAWFIAFSVTFSRIFRPITWGDELNTLSYFQQTWRGMLTTVDAPLWYIGARLSQLGPVALRFTSLLALFGTVVLVFKIAEYYINAQHASLASLLVVLNDALLQPATWIRMYSWLVFFVALLWWLVIRYHEHPRPLLLGAISIATVLIHQTGIVAVILLLGVLGYRSEHRLRIIPIAVMGSGIGLLMLGPRIYRAITGNYDTVGHLSTGPSMKDLLLTPYRLLGGYPKGYTGYVLGLILVAAILYLIHRTSVSRDWIEPLTLIGIVLGLYAGFSYLIDPIYTVKYFIWVAPMLIVGIVALLSKQSQRIETIGYGILLACMATGFVY